MRITKTKSLYQNPIETRTFFGSTVKGHHYCGKFISQESSTWKRGSARTESAVKSTAM